MDQDNTTVREDLGYTGYHDGRPQIRPARIRIRYSAGIDQGNVRSIRMDIAKEMIRAGIAREVADREPGEEG